MKSYPSIPKYKGESLYMHTFTKLDGSNLRFEWSKKRGWYKFGTRNRLFDHTDLVFGSAIQIFQDTLAEMLTKKAVDNRWQNIVAFCEFWGKESFAGVHQPDDHKYLSLLDLDIHKYGFMSPKDFVKEFEDSTQLYYIGNIKWNNEYAITIYNQESWYSTLGMQNEGVVGKAGEKHNIIRYKTKTKWWYDKVYEIHGPEKGKLIAES